MINVERNQPLRHFKGAAVSEGENNIFIVGKTRYVGMALHNTRHV